MSFLIVIVGYLVIEIMMASGSLSSMLKSLLVPVTCYIVAALGLNLNVGVSGELNLGQAGFMCLGAFMGVCVSGALAPVITNGIVRLVLAIIVGALVAAVFGILIGIPVLKLQGDYLGIADLIGYYSGQMAALAEAVTMNATNSKLSKIFWAGDQASAESFKKMFDKIESGEPAVFVGKSLFNEDGSPNWQMFNQDLKSSYIISDIMEDMRKWELKFCSDLGIPNSNTEKKERMITSEVESNNVEVKLWADLALESLKEGCEQAREMFGITLDVDWRFNTEEVSSNDDRIS
jgi:hypothetical protein